MVEGRNDAVGIELEVVGPKLVAGQEVELDLREGKLLGVEDETHPLAAGGLRRVVEGEHASFSLGSLSWPGIAREDGRKRPNVPAISLRLA
jgi:hypothetical protein